MAISGNLNDRELAKFSEIGTGTVAVNVNSVGGASGYAEGTTVGTVTGNAIVFRETLGTLQAVGTAHPLPVTQQTLLAGEDLTANLIVTENRYSYAYNSAVGTTTIKSGAGFLHSLTLAAPSAGGALNIYDSVGTSASIICSIGTAATIQTFTFNCTFATGLSIANVGTQPYSVSYR